MGILASFMDRRVGAELNERGVLVWYDPAGDWHPWIEAVRGEKSPAQEGAAIQVTIGGRDGHLVVSTGSHYEVLRVCEPLVSSAEMPRLLVYVPNEPYLETLSPLRELECLGGQKDAFLRELAQVARQALQSAGLSESKIDELLNRDGLDFNYLDSISVGDAGASPLAPVFGSSRELDVLPSFLAEPERRAEVAEKGLLGEVVQLVESSAGIVFLAEHAADATPEQSAERFAAQLGRALLVAEFRDDLEGPEPVEISQIPAPTKTDQRKRVRDICHRLRREYADEYEEIADTVEQELGLARAEIDALSLGRIDTFRFEERRLLDACDGLLAQGAAEQARQIVNGRIKEESFWASVIRYPTRHAAWEACGEFAQLSLAIDEVEEALKKPPQGATEWVHAYCADDGWHRMDQRFREARYRLSGLEDPAILERGSERIFGRYDDLLERMASGFVQTLKDDGWKVKDILPQEEIYDRLVARQSEPIAYILADAMRFEMGSELVGLLEAIGATTVRLEPAVAVAPSITDLGMAALLPGAERSFSMTESPKGVTGVIRGRALIGSAARMDYAKGEVPGLVEMTLNRLVHELSPKKREEELRGAKVIVIRSQEIDGIGENIPEGVAQKIMGTILEDLRTAVQRLSDAGVHRFVIVADHGHFFAGSKGDDMKIDPPEGGKKVDIHRRCWVGRGGSTPSACVRLSSSDLGYEGTDLELVVPKGTGVFKAGGSLAFHHGGLSLQELIIPVLSFERTSKKAAKKKASDELLALDDVDKKITNRIFSLRLKPLQLDLFEPLRVRIIAESTADKRIVAQAAWASEGWDSEGRIVTLVSGEPVDLRLLLDDDTAQELRVVVVEVGTERTLKDTEPIPVSLMS